MDLRAKISKELREVYGEFKSNLEGVYERTIIDKLYEFDASKRLTEEDLYNKRVWLTYNQVIVELKNNIKDMLTVKELQYRLTDYEDPNTVCLEVINRLDNLSPELKRLYDKINNFN